MVVQWDPERALDVDAREKADSPYLRKLADVRSLQVGLRGAAWARFFHAPAGEGCVLRITDVTADFRGAHAELKAGDLAKAEAKLWPEPQLRESRFITSPAVSAAIGVSATE